MRTRLTVAVVLMTLAAVLFSPLALAAPTVDR